MCPIQSNHSASHSPSYGCKRFSLVVSVSDSLLSGHGFESDCGPFASNFEQVANLYGQVNSASYPSRDGK